MSLNRKLANIITSTGDIKQDVFGNLATSVDSATVLGILDPRDDIAVYDSLGLLPVTGLTRGTQALVQNPSRLYLSNGLGWYNVSLVNQNPSFDSDINATFAIVDSATPLIISNPASDPDGNVTYGGTFSDSGQYFVTLTRDSSVWTFTPLSADSVFNNVTIGNLTDSDGGDFTYTFSATDGISTAQKTITISYTGLKPILDLPFPTWDSSSGTLGELVYPSWGTEFGSGGQNYGQHQYDQHGKYTAISHDGKRVATSSAAGSAIVIYDRTNNTAPFGRESFVISYNSSAILDSSEFQNNANTLGNDARATDANMGFQMSGDGKRILDVNSAGYGGSGPTFYIYKEGDSAGHWIAEYDGADMIAELNSLGETPAALGNAGNANLSASIDRFGMNVAVNYNPGNGTCYTYFIERDSAEATTWSWVNTINHTSGWPGVNYSNSQELLRNIYMSGNGQYCAIGAGGNNWFSNNAPSNTNASVGGCFVMYKDNGTWTQQAHLFAANQTAYNGGNPSQELGNWGVHLDSDGVRAVATDPDWNYGQNPRGRAIVWKRTGSSWAQEAELTDGTTSGFGYLQSNYQGTSCMFSADGRKLAITNRLTSSNNSTNVGGINLYARDSGSTTWYREAVITPNDDIGGTDNLHAAELGEGGINISGNGNFLFFGSSRPSGDGGAITSCGAAILIRDNG